MAQATPGSDYTVQQGDTLFSIAQQAYGDGNQWPVIANANGISDPNHITPGQVLYIPALTATPGSDYNVQQGDTLFSIAQQAYGNGNQWQVIANANGIPNAGQVLYIPTIGPTITCKVTSADGLNARSAPTSKSTLVSSFARGTVVSYFEAVVGENVSGNQLWGHSDQGYYFWLGATDHPNG
jgi:LysM repeat protein